MDGVFVALKATDDQETAVRVFTEYDRVAFPVTDTTGILLGIVTVDDVLDVIEEEATEDIHRMGAIEALEQPYMQTGYAAMLRKRAPWLVLLLIGQFLTLNVMNFFSEEIEQALFLVAFVPLIISSGGNSGSQAATLVIRAMALEEVTLADWWRVLRREIVFGVSLGAILASFGFARVLASGVTGRDFGVHWGLLGAVVGASLVGVVLWGVLIGSMLPFVLRRFGFDPAVSSTPFVATVCDVTGLLIYFGVAALLLL
jgi:magnesium transporter